MSSCGRLNFTNVSQSVFECIRATVNSDYNIEMPDQPSGTVSTKGFTVSWSFDFDNGNGWVECTDSPFLVPCSVINGQIQSIVTGCGGQPA